MKCLVSFVRIVRYRSAMGDFGLSTVISFRFAFVSCFPVLRTYGFTSYLRNGGLVFHVLI